MADPTAVTGIVLAVAAVATSATPLVLARRARNQDRGEADTASWEGLNNALNREIARLQAELGQQKAEYHAEMAKQRADYQQQLDSARKRITELEAEVTTLQRLLRPR